MTKQLCLLRHAEAGAQQPGRGDVVRELTPTGKNQARQAGSIIHGQQIPMDAIFCSTAIRARQTLMIATEQMPFKLLKIFYSDELYETSTDSILEFLRTRDENLNSVMIVGHNPSLSQLATSLTGSSMGLTPASLVLIDLDIVHWSEITAGCGKLALHHYPGIEKSPAS